MSKIGRKFINTEGVQVEVKSQGKNLLQHTVHYKGKFASGVYALPVGFEAEIAEPNMLAIKVVAGTLTARAKGTEPKAEGAKLAISTKYNELWGLHRALLASAIQGARTLFERSLEIKGLGFKAIVRGTALEFSLGFSHKKMYELPQEVTATVDKTGQKIMLSCPYKERLGQVASEIRALRPPEPYKGTGIRYLGEQVRHKAGKTK
jgi:large subunit ribosomal protein L6